MIGGSNRPLVVRMSIFSRLFTLLATLSGVVSVASPHEATPTILLPTYNGTLSDAALVWMNLDSDCILHFCVTIMETQETNRPLSFFLGTSDNRQRTFHLRRPIENRQETHGYKHIGGVATSIPDELLMDLDRGLAFIQVNNRETGQALFRGNVTLANSCWLDLEVANNEDGDDYTRFRLNYYNDLPVCHFEGQIYDEGDTWLPFINPECTTCTCEKRGIARCHTMICPVLTCDNQKLRSGDCCPSCPGEDDSELCSLGSGPRKYRAHSVWHPYLPMHGFEKCAVCRCYPGGVVQCHKSPCPVTKCHKSHRVKSQTDPCCYECIY